MQNQNLSQMFMNLVITVKSSRWNEVPWTSSDLQDVLQQYDKIVRKHAIIFCEYANTLEYKTGIYIFWSSSKDRRLHPELS